MKVAVTGAGGYIGLRLVNVLAARPDVSVRALTRVRRELPPGVEQLSGDLLGDERLLADLCDGADTIVHLAGPNEVRASADPGHTVVDVVSGAMRVAEVSVRAGIARAIYLSTIHVYGAHLRPGGRVDEDTPCEPQSAYAIARLAAEELLAAYGPPGLVVFRVTNAVGAPAAPDVDRWSLVANDLCRQGAKTGRLRLRTDGMQWRDFVALADVCRIVAEVSVSEQFPGGIYNLGRGQAVRVRHLAGMVQDGFEAAGRERPELDAPAPAPAPEDIASCPPEVSVERLAKEGHRAEGSVRAAVDETVRFCLVHREELP